MTSVEMPRMSDRETEEAGLQAEAAEREVFEARFPPETFSQIAEAMGLPAEPEIRDAARSFRYSGAWITVGSLGKAED